MMKTLSRYAQAMLVCMCMQSMMPTTVLYAGCAHNVKAMCVCCVGWHVLIGMLSRVWRSMQDIRMHDTVHYHSQQREA